MGAAEYVYISMYISMYIPPVKTVGAQDIRQPDFDAVAGRTGWPQYERVLLEKGQSCIYNLASVQLCTTYTYA